MYSAEALGRELDIDSKKSEHQVVESITNSMIEPGDDETSETGQRPRASSAFRTKARWRRQ